MQRGTFQKWVGRATIYMKEEGSEVCCILIIATQVIHCEIHCALSLSFVLLHQILKNESTVAAGKQPQRLRKGKQAFILEVKPNIYHLYHAVSPVSLKTEGFT